MSLFCALLVGAYAITFDVRDAKNWPESPVITLVKDMLKQLFDMLIYAGERHESSIASVASNTMLFERVSRLCIARVSIPRGWQASVNMHPEAREGWLHLLWLLPQGIDTLGCSMAVCLCSCLCRCVLLLLLYHGAVCVSHGILESKFNCVKNGWSIFDISHVTLYLYDPLIFSVLCLFGSTWNQCSRYHLKCIVGNMKEVIVAVLAGEVALLAPVATHLL